MTTPDADLKQAIVTGILRREPTIDFQAANTADLSSLSDSEVLSLAAKEGRILVSHDQRTMPIYFAEFITARTSSGVIIVLQSLPTSDAISNLIKIWPPPLQSGVILD
ncbi:DUF5615 family PIN-like protein [Chroococcidiopsis sp. CCMEE 29]|uniref:DUF5615 family PIN-like protein n=1 Tax=Chroococcidiopsis sp. CCMEE 29 TaxID=155894 RepID=UPI0020201D03|nr:DUF5615 family PIN-like protein [Chroococcidiopsis sp. CCMEE 29]